MCQKHIMKKFCCFLEIKILYVFWTFPLNFVVVMVCSYLPELIIGY